MQRRTTTLLRTLRAVDEEHWRRVTLHNIGRQYRTLFRKFVQGVATVEIEPRRINVRFGRRAKNPALIQAGFGDGEQPIPWRRNKPLRLVFS